MAANLAPVFLDDARVSLQGDPRPNVKKIVIAVGKNPDECVVYQLRSQTDMQGREMNLDEVIDRTLQVDAPVYLRCETGSEPGTRPPRARKSPQSTPPASGTAPPASSPAPAPEPPAPNPGTSPSPPPQGVQPGTGPNPPTGQENP